MLAKIKNLGEEIALVPDSGVQFVDLALDLNKHRQLTRTFIERVGQHGDGREHRQLLRIPDIDEDEVLPREFETQRDAPF